MLNPLSDASVCWVIVKCRPELSGRKGGIDSAAAYSYCTVSQEEGKGNGERKERAGKRNKEGREGKRRFPIRR